MMVTFEVPNLDCEESEELLALQTVFMQLAQYCANKRNAMAFRLKGQIAEATMYENKCDRIYHDLPEWARW